jgi:hypothetical protein
MIPLRFSYITNTTTFGTLGDEAVPIHNGSLKDYCASKKGILPFELPSERRRRKKHAHTHG